MFRGKMCSNFFMRRIILDLLILPEASFGLRLMSWPAFVGLCVRVCVYQSRACPHDNSSFIHSYCFEGWSTLTFKVQFNLKVEFYPFWVCPHHNSSAVQARFPKFGSKMHRSTVKIPINFGLDWFWSSLSFSILKSIFLPNLFSLFL